MRHRSELNERRLALLLEVSDVLGSSLNYEATLKNLARNLVPRIADWCSVDIVGDDGMPSLLAVAHMDPEKVELGYEYRRMYPPLPSDATGLMNVLRTGKPELYSDMPDELLEKTVLEKERLRVVRSLGLRSLMIVPLALGERVLGALTLVSTRAELRYEADDLELACEIALRAALAIDRAELHRKADEARKQAESANRMKDEFLATVSHELRTPLNAILGWASILRSGEPDAAAIRRGVEVIERNARAQARLIDDVLDVSRIIAGKLRIERHPVDVARVVSAALDAVGPSAAGKGIAISVEIAPNAGMVLGDPDRLQQIVWNLASNAVKFTPRGGRVEVRADRIGARARIVVRDTGQGIDAGLLPFVFDRFRQGDSSSSRAHGGLGLGLAIASHLVELHGGSIKAESEGRGKGATFIIMLPIAEVATGDGAVRGHSTPNDLRLARSLPLSGLTILIVDDEADSRELLAMVLEGSGASVIAADSGAAALERIESARPDVLVADIAMPHMDGYTLIRRVRALAPEKGGRTPALALTAYAAEADRKRAFAAGYQLHAAKPVNVRELIADVANLGGRPLDDD
jgi:signal transduction histidine kinase